MSTDHQPPRRPGRERDEVVWAVYENSRYLPIGVFMLWAGWRALTRGISRLAPRRAR